MLADDAAAAAHEAALAEGLERRAERGRAAPSSTLRRRWTVVPVMILVELALDAAGREHTCFGLDRVAEDAAAAVREVADLEGLERRAE